MNRKLLTLEADYSLNTIQKRGLEHIVKSRDLDGYFEHVWSVYPSAGSSPDEPPERSVGRPSITFISDRHTMVEGKVARTKLLARLPHLNFALAQISLVSKLDRLIAEEGISIVRASDPFYLAPLGLLLAKSSRVPLVIRLIANYDSSYYSAGNPAYPRLYRWRSVEKKVARFMLQRADLVAAGNQDISTYALANGASRERLTVFLVGNLIEPVHFEVLPDERPSVRAEFGLEDRRLIVTVCRLEPDKHPEDLPRVVALVKAEFPDVAALLVGDGSMRSELDALVLDLGLAEDFTFAGERTQGWIADALSSADVIVSPVTGRALVEACLSGSPVVAYDTDWQGELIRPGQTGVLVKYRDTQEMANAVCELLRDPAQATAIGARARAFALESMDPTSLSQNERDVYDKLLADSFSPGCRADGGDTGRVGPSRLAPPK